MTPAQIQRRRIAWTVLSYEWDMYQATWQKMQVPLREFYPQSVANAIVESHSLHIRNLCNFLVASKDDDDDDALDYSDLVERFEEVDIHPLNKLWYSLAAGHPGSPAFVLSAMADCTIHRRESYDYNSIVEALHKPLCELVDQIRQVRQWEIRNCLHVNLPEIDCCEKCGASKEEIFHLEHSCQVPPPAPKVRDEAPAPEEAREETTQPDQSR